MQLILARCLVCVLVVASLQLAAAVTSRSRSHTSYVYLPNKVADGYLLDGDVKVTFDQMAALKTKLRVQTNTKEITGFHLTQWPKCIRALARGVTQADMMELVQNPYPDKEYGGGMHLELRQPSIPAPTRMGDGRIFRMLDDNKYCYLAVTIKKGTPRLDNNILSSVGITLTTGVQKASLCAMLGCVLQYPDVMQVYNVTSIAEVDLAYSKASSPTPGVPTPNMTLLNLWSLLEGRARTVLSKELGLPATHQAFTSLSWLKSFLIFLQYTDGIQAVRAIRQQNPWAANEPDHFGAFQKAYTALLNARLAQPEAKEDNFIVVDGYKYLFSALGKINGAIWEGYRPEDWATRLSKEALPRLCKLVTGSSKDCGLRWRPASSGGSPTNLTNNDVYTATLAQQLYRLQKNPYLYVRSTDKAADGTARVHYYHPDPLHLNPQLESRVDPRLWTLLKTTNYSANPQLLKEHGTRLTQGLVWEALRRHSGEPIGNTMTHTMQTTGGSALLQDLLSIHPFTEFNTRIVFFFMAVMHIESASLGQDERWTYGDIRSPFISDFALVNGVSEYQTVLNGESDAMSTLRGELFVEWVRGLKSKKPNYFSLPAWGRYINNALIVSNSNKKKIEFDDTDYRLIKNERYGELMQRKLGPNWYASVN